MTGTEGHTEPDHEGTRLAEILAATDAALESAPLVLPPGEFAAVRKVAAALGLELRPAAPPVPSAEDTGPAGAADGLAEMRAATAAVHVPGPRRMIGRQATRRDCLGCGRPWPCEHSWQARAEDAEARLAEIAAHCRLRMNAPGRSGMTMAAAGLILGIAEGGGEEEARDA